MLTNTQLKDYAYLRSLSMRDIEAYCKLSAQHISMILNGERPLSEENYREIVNGINLAYAAKKDGTFTRRPLDKNCNTIREDSAETSKTESAPKNRKKTTNIEK